MSIFNKYPYTDFHELNADWILETIGDIQTKIATYDAIISELQEQLTRIPAVEDAIKLVNSKMVILENQVTDIKLDISNLQKVSQNHEARIKLIEDYVSDSTKYVDDQINLVRNELLALINHNYNDLYVRINDINLNNIIEFNKLQNQIDVITKLIHDYGIDGVFNPVRGIKQDVNENNKSIYADMRYGGITNIELANLKINNEDLQKRFINNRDFALNSRFRLVKPFEYYSPLTGLRTTVSNIVSGLLTNIKNTITNDEYEAYGLTNDEFEALALTNNEYLTYRR